MPINPELRICFIHIPKTGGTTIEHLIPNIHPNNCIGIKPYDNQECDYKYLFGNNLQHLTFNEIIKLKPEILKDNYFIFTLVRNPYSRVVSMAAWFNKRWIKNEPISKTEFNKYIDGLEMRWKKNNLFRHEIPQNQYLDDELLFVDNIIKLEELSGNKILEMEKMMCFKNIDFKFNFNPNLILMKSHHFSYLDYFKNNKKAIKLINLIYDLDFQKFNYTRFNDELFNQG